MYSSPAEKAPVWVELPSISSILGSYLVVDDRESRANFLREFFLTNTFFFWETEGEVEVLGTLVWWSSSLPPI